MCSKELQSKNARSRISSNELPKATDVMFGQKEKALVLMMVTESGITISPVRFLHERNDACPIKFSVLGNTTEVISSQSRNALKSTRVIV